MAGSFLLPYKVHAGRIRPGSVLMPRDRMLWAV